MTRLARDWKSFAARVKMGKARTWIVLEGRDGDRPFYDELVKAGKFDTNGPFEFILAEEISIDGASAGGKQHSQKIFAKLESSDLLLQRSNSGATRVGFILDRDDDPIQKLAVDHPHVIYTRMADVEGEIYANTDLHKAASAAFGVTRSQASALGESAIGSLEELALSSKKWIQLRLIAAICGKPYLAPLAAISSINRDCFGELLEPDASDREARIMAALTQSQIEIEVSRVEDFVTQHFDDGRGHLLLKGKWIGPFLLWKAGNAFAGEVVRRGTTAHIILAACISSLIWHPAWVEHYRSRFDRLLTSGDAAA